MDEYMEDMYMYYNGININKRVDNEIKRLTTVKKQCDQYFTQLKNKKDGRILFNGEYNELINEFANIDDALNRHRIKQYLKGEYWNME